MGQVRLEPPYRFPHNGALLEPLLYFLKEEVRRIKRDEEERKEEEGRRKRRKKQAPPCILCYIHRCPHKRSYGSLHDCMKSVHLSQFVDKFFFSSNYSKEYIFN